MADAAVSALANQHEGAEDAIKAFQAAQAALVDALQQDYFCDDLQPPSWAFGWSAEDYKTFCACRDPVWHNPAAFVDNPLGWFDSRLCRREWWRHRAGCRWWWPAWGSIGGAKEASRPRCGADGVSHRD